MQKYDFFYFEKILYNYFLLFIFTAPIFVGKLNKNSTNKKNWYLLTHQIKFLLNG